MLDQYIFCGEISPTSVHLKDTVSTVKQSRKTRSPKRRSASKPPQTGFAKLGLSKTMLKTLEKIGYEEPSPVQQAVIPIAINGTDCTGQARTGTGKTAAFAIPILEQLDFDYKGVQAIVLAPTRELSEQVAEEFRRLAQDFDCEVVTVVGGRSMGPQISAIQRGAQVVVGTPGRVIDLMRRGNLKLGDIEFVVLDEADRMLDIGFRPDIEKILRQCPKDRQTLLLSATMPPSVERLAQRYMQDPQRVDLSQDGISSSETIEQFYATVDEEKKLGFLVRLLIKERPQQAIVFARTKRGTERIYKHFANKLPGVEMMTGDLQQSKRDRVMKKFRDGSVRLLIATDVVGRGIDVSGISHIVNYDIPEYHDDYVHRIGRTGRLSSSERGRAITLVTREQGGQLTSIEVRVNQLLKEYKLPDYEAFQSRGPRPKVNDAGNRGKAWTID